jgi:tetratricopeptide (TPR) repeat protein/CBS domain-containing protein
MANCGLIRHAALAGLRQLAGSGTGKAGRARSASRVPLTSVIMIFEITRGYSIVVPLMISNLISYFISSRFQREPIYDALQRQDGVHLPSAARDREGLLLAGHALRPADEVLPADDSVDHVLASVSRERQAWPVTGQGGLLGMITIAQLEEAVRDGRGGQRLAGLTAASSVYVHADHPLDTVMQCMAEAGLDTPPVVSRANLRGLVGVVSLWDVLAAYGLEKGRKPVAGPGNESTTPLSGLVSVLAAVAGILLISVFLSYFCRAQRAEGARESYQAGNELAKEGRYPEAIERYRNALSISHTSEHRLALALALVEAGRLNEAEACLRELLKGDPGSGPANLGLARVAAGKGDLQEAATYFHRAICGSWSANRLENRVQARVELVEVLGKSGQKTQAQAELLSLVAEMPADLAVRKRAGHLLLEFGLHRESAGGFRDVLQQDKRDAEAQVGLGEAKLARENYLPAWDAFRHSLEFNPGHDAAKRRLELCEEILTLDPTIRRLGAAERFRRSEKLVEAALRTLDQCAADSGASALPDSARGLADAARKSLSRRQRPRSLGDAADSNISLAEQLRGARSQACRSATGADEALSRVMARLSR